MSFEFVHCIMQVIDVAQALPRGALRADDNLLRQHMGEGDRRAGVVDFDELIRQVDSGRFTAAVDVFPQEPMPGAASARPLSCRS